MKVEYLQCDICGKKISNKEIRYGFIERYGDVLDTPKDLCGSCADRMVKWIKREIKNAAST